MKKAPLFLVPFIALLVTFCKKDKVTEPSPEPTVQDNYASLNEFYAKNGVPLQTFTINAGEGGTYVSAEGTTVNIPANTFTPASANITIEFKDIYKKSDMLLSKVATNLSNKRPLKSAGEFFIKALNNNTAIAIENTATGISVLQPIKQKQPVDTGMRAFIGAVGADSTQNLSWYQPDPAIALLNSNTNYIFSLYKFSSPLSSGTWCNSDNSGYFSAYPQTVLTLHPNQALPNTDMFLVFKNINSMVHVYSSGTNFKYNFAPVGLECTVVALGVRNGKLQSCFIPIVISSGQTVNFDLKETTTDDFKAALKALD